MKIFAFRHSVLDPDKYPEVKENLIDDVRDVITHMSSADKTDVTSFTAVVYKCDAPKLSEKFKHIRNYLSFYISTQMEKPAILIFGDLSDVALERGTAVRFLNKIDDMREISALYLTSVSKNDPYHLYRKEYGVYYTGNPEPSSGRTYDFRAMFEKTYDAIISLYYKRSETIPLYEIAKMLGFNYRSLHNACYDEIDSVVAGAPLSPEEKQLLQNAFAIDRTRAERKIILYMHDILPLN